MGGILAEVVLAILDKRRDVWRTIGIQMVLGLTIA